MNALLALGCLSFLICFILTPICRDRCLRWNIVDHPDDERKFHTRPIPRIGGVPIAFSYVAALVLMLAFAPHGAQIAIQHKTLLWSLLPAATLIFATGLVDDLLGLKPWQKLAGQLAAAVLAVSMGARITLVGGLPMSDWVTIPLSVLWLVGCTNAFNLIDGLDGLAAGVGLFATLTTLLAAILQGNAGLAIATIPLAGCLLAFLRYNFNPASVFLGDSGSLTIGFLLGCFGLIWSQKSATLLGMVAPLMAFALPLMDVVLSIIRRLLRGEPVFKADRGHIHHRLLALGLKPRDASLVLYGVCGIAAILSLAQSVVDLQFRGFIVILFCSLSWIGIKRLSYVEFRAARFAISKNSLFRVLKDEIYKHNLKEQLARIDTLDSCWQILMRTCKDFGISSVHLHLAGRSFEEHFSEKEDSSLQMTFSLGKNGSLTLTRASGASTPGLLMSVFDLFQETIEAKQSVWLNVVSIKAMAAGTGASGPLFHDPVRVRSN